MALGLDILKVARINRRARALDDSRNVGAEMQWTRRIPTNNDVLDGDIMMRYQGRHQIADLIAEDSRAVTYKVGKFQLETNTAPKIKSGIVASESEIKALANLANGAPVSMVGMDADTLVNGMLNSLMIGQDWRGEALRIAMLMDGFSYDRLGIKIASASWGLPSDLKVTPGTPWTTSASATPVNDIYTLKEVARVKYGLNLTRMTMSMQGFRVMIATTEFQNKAKLLIASPYDIPTNFVLNNYGVMIPLAERVTGMTIEFNDFRYWSTDSTGARASARFWPIEKIVLSDPTMDGRMDNWDYANGLVVESAFLGMMNSATPQQIGQLSRGPLYYASYPPTLDPPELTIWGVSCGFPRKVNTLATHAWLSIGSLTDAIAVTDPF